MDQIRDGGAASPGKFQIEPQPDDTTCGPTCLHAVYRFYNDPIELKPLIKEVKGLKGGGTLGVLLGTHALKRGYKAFIYSYNLRVFDPTWVYLTRLQLIEKLEQSLQYRTRPKLRLVINSYLEFLRLGGEIRFAELTDRLIVDHLEQGTPVLTGLSSTYLYRDMREIPDTNRADDLAGEPAGHFVVLYHYDPHNRLVELADPWSKNPIGSKPGGHGLYYSVNIQRLINSILLGVLTYDGNLLVIAPSEKPGQ